jgi:hypothetical protein
MPENCLAASTAASAELPPAWRTRAAAFTADGLKPVNGATVRPAAAAAAEPLRKVRRSMLADAIRAIFDST